MKFQSNPIQPKGDDMTVKVTKIKIDMNQAEECIGSMLPCDNVIVNLSCEKYMDEGTIQHLKYEGPLKEVLLEIANNHSYGMDEEEVDECSCVDIITSIEDTNGDGCDYIVGMEVINHSSGEVVRVI